MPPSWQEGVRLHARVVAAADREALATLPFDFERYVEVEPRLRSAQWLTPGGPGVGKRAEVVVDIPFTVPLVRRVFASADVIATVTEWEPPQRSAITFESHRFTGHAQVRLLSLRDGCRVDVDGRVRPRARLAQVALRPLGPLVERLATRAIERGVGRAAAAAPR